MNTPVTDLLDRGHVPYRRLHFTRPAPTVEELVREQGVRLDEMVKAILLREQSGTRRYAMACVLGGARVDPPAVRGQLPAAESWKRLSFASPQEIIGVTGVQPGLVAPLLLPPEVPIVFDLPIAQLDRVNIASGHPLLGLELAREDLVRVSRPVFADISRKSPDA